jgi:uncharacterized protein (TIGR03066 family)
MRPAPKKVTPQPGGPWLPKWTMPILCFFGSAAGTIALFEGVLLGEIPAMMQGKWVVVEGELEGASLEFLRDGSMIGTIKADGKEAAIKGKVHMAGDGFRLTTSNSPNGIEVTDEQTILDLSDEQLVIQDRRGEVLKMTRVHSLGRPAAR